MPADEVERMAFALFVADLPWRGHGSQTLGPLGQRTAVTSRTEVPPYEREYWTTLAGAVLAAVDEEWHEWRRELSSTMNDRDRYRSTLSDYIDVDEFDRQSRCCRECDGFGTVPTGECEGGDAGEVPCSQGCSSSPADLGEGGS